MCIEQEYEGEVLHPGATGWNTIGLKSGLIGELAYDGGYTILYVGFEPGFTSYFATDVSAAIESFCRMIDAFSAFEANNEVLFFASAAEAMEHRAAFMGEYEKRLPEIEARLAEIQIELNAVEQEIIRIYAEFFKK